MISSLLIMMIFFPTTQVEGGLNNNVHRIYVRRGNNTGQKLRPELFHVKDRVGLVVLDSLCLFLMTVRTASFFALVRGYLMSFSFLTAWHILQLKNL